MYVLVIKSSQFPMTRDDTERLLRDGATLVARRTNGSQIQRDYVATTTYRGETEPAHFSVVSPVANDDDYPVVAS